MVNLNKDQIKRGHDCKTEAELIALIPRNDGIRDSNYCSQCGQKGGSSIGNSTYSQTHNYYWWHCSKCGRDYDLTIQEHKLPPGMKSPFDRKTKGKKKNAKSQEIF